MERFNLWNNGFLDGKGNGLRHELTRRFVGHRQPLPNDVIRPKRGYAARTRLSLGQRQVTLLLLLLSATRHRLRLFVFVDVLSARPVSTDCHMQVRRPLHPLRHILLSSSWRAPHTVIKTHTNVCFDDDISGWVLF